MTEKKDLKLSFVTPRAVAIYPKLSKPDVKWKEEGEYSVKHSFAKDTEGFLIGRETVNLETLTERLQEMLDEYYLQKKAELASAKDGKTKAKAKSLTKREIFAAEFDDEGNETGNVVMKPHMKASGVSKKDQKPWKRTVPIFDAKRKKMDPVPDIYGGSELKTAIEAVPYYAPNDNAVGITLRLEAVQVLKLVQGGGRDASAFGFGEEEGFVDEGPDGDQFADAGADDASSADEF